MTLKAFSEHTEKRITASTIGKFVLCLVKVIIK
jgi:hypothetical protein